MNQSLAACLLAGQPNNLVIVGNASGSSLVTAAGGDYAPQILRFDNLGHCLARDSQAVLAQQSGSTVALIELSSDTLDSAGLSLDSALGQSVRLFPDRLVVGLDSTEPEDTTFFAFGFRMLRIDGAGSTRWFEYCLREYKRPPDWLNARYWANPERFGLDEDPDIYCEENGDEEE